MKKKSTTSNTFMALENRGKERAWGREGTRKEKAARLVYTFSSHPVGSTPLRSPALWD
jgi:hypothetical protein